MDTLRQRIPFKLSENDEQENRQILDEQEQEEVIESLRKLNKQSTEYHYKFLQGCLSFMILFHIWFLVMPRQLTPVHVFLPNYRTPHPPLIPFASGFAFLNIILLFNVVLYLPSDLSFHRVLLSIISQAMSCLPLPAQQTLKPYIPLPLKWIVGLLLVPSALSVLTFSDMHQIFWWLSPLLVVGIFLLVVSWIKENETEVEELEKLRYDAKGA